MPKVYYTRARYIGSDATAIRHPASRSNIRRGRPAWLLRRVKKPPKCLRVSLSLSPFPFPSHFPYIFYFSSPSTSSSPQSPILPTLPPVSLVLAFTILPSPAPTSPPSFPSCPSPSVSLSFSFSFLSNPFCLPLLFHLIHPPLSTSPPFPSYPSPSISLSFLTFPFSLPVFAEYDSCVRGRRATAVRRKRGGRAINPSRASTQREIRTHGDAWRGRCVCLPLLEAPRGAISRTTQTNGR